MMSVIANEKKTGRGLISTDWQDLFEELHGQLLAGL